MSKISKQVDQQHLQHQSDSDLSLQLSDASSLSSDSDLSDAQVKKKTTTKKKSTKKTLNKKKKVKDDFQYCTCRKGYDGKEFMIECDGCQEWFHGACVGLKPNSVTDHYYCKSCLKVKKRPSTSAGKKLIPQKKSIIILPVPKPEPAIIPMISKLSIDQDDEDEDLCPVCDGDCTCGSDSPLPQPPPQPPQPPQPIVHTEPAQPKIVVIKKTTLAPKSKKTMKPKKSIIVKEESSGSSSSESGSSDSQTDSGGSSSSDEDTIVEMIGSKKQESKKKLTSAPRRGKSTTLLANIIRQKAPHYASKGGKKSNFVPNTASISTTKKEELSSEDEDEDVVVDDLDDLLETMSPLSENSSNESELESEEFFTDDDEDEDVNMDNEDIDIDSSSLVMSPYPESRASYSSVHIDSGDDEDIENVETQAIIADMTLDSDEEELDSDLDEGMFIEDEDDDEDEEPDIPLSLGYYAANNNRWSSDEDEEEEEFDYTTALPSDEDGNISDDSEEDKQVNPFLPLLDSEGNIYDSIAAAFMQSFAPISTDTGGDTTNGINTPALGEEYQLSPFELAQALNALSAETSRQHNQDFLRRPSLPSNAVSAAQRHRGSQDFNTSEALRALSVLVTDDLSLAPLQPIHEDLEMESLNDTPPMQSPIDNSSPPFTNDVLPNHLALSLSTDLKLQEQILDILKGSDKLPHTTTHITNTLEKKSSLPTNTALNPSRQILPKPSGSGIGSSFPTLALEQQIQDAINESIENNKKRGLLNEEDSGGHSKKRRISRSNSLSASIETNLQPMETTSFSTPASPAAIIDELEDMMEDQDSVAVSMDDLVDTSQLYTRSLSRSPSPEVEDDPYSRDLSRWQRIPIGAFRLMRSRNKLWLER